MSELNKNLEKSIELAKSGFDNAQARIGAIDAKVGVAVGFLVVLLPAPLLAAVWLSGLQNAAATNIFWACSNCCIASSITAICLLIGMVCAFFAILSGFSSLTPRGPKGYGKTGPFQNEWRPNVLFALHKPDKTAHFCEHLRKLHSGVDLAFIVNEYDHQLQQLGRILDAKFDEMGKCFWWLNCCLACYGVAIFFAAWILLNAVLHGARP